MKKLLWALLLGCLLIQPGCKTQQPSSGLKVTATATIDGREHVVSAAVGKDGKFNNSVTKDGRTQTISGQVTKTDDVYSVTIGYNSTKAAVPGLIQVSSNVSLHKGESQSIGGMGDNGNNIASVSVKLSD